MKNFPIGWFVVSLVFTVSKVQAQHYINYTPEARLKYAEKNRANHISMVVLHFCERGQTKIRYPDVRIVAKKFENGSVVVNPQKEDLGWSLNTLDLSKLHLATAQKILCAEDNGDESFTCNLIAGLPNSIKQNYQLDLKFADELLYSYRLRGPGITAPSWVDFTKNSEL
jgi:hypothetical protein